MNKPENFERINRRTKQHHAWEGKDDVFIGVPQVIRPHVVDKWNDPVNFKSPEYLRKSKLTNRANILSAL